ncbi:MAG TPA: AgmX/PglI C-terminal domain-containing protein [Myxococcales bacterium]
MASPFRVRVFRGEQLLDERIFNETLVKLGRHSSTHVPLDDRSASFVHAVLTVDGDEIALTDISGRGTFVNGKSIGKKVLAQGDEIRIAGLRVLVDLPPLTATAPAPLPPVPAPAPSPAPTVAAAAPAQTEEGAASKAGVEPEPAPPTVERPEACPQSSFGTYVPSEPRPPRRLRPNERPALQLSCYWGDQLLQVTQHREPKTILMGPTPRCEVKAGSRERPLIEPADGGFALNVEEGLRAHLRRGDDVRELEPGVHALEPTDLAWLETGHLRVEACFAAAPEPARVPVAQSIDFRLVNLVLAISFVAAAFAIAAQFRDKDDLVADDLSAASNLYVQVMEPLRRAKLRTDALPSLDPTEPAAPAPKHSGPEGQAGDPTVKHRKPAIGAVGSIRVDTKTLVTRPGLLAELGGPNAANLLGLGGVKGDVIAALGNLTGPSYGNAAGVGGLGLRGGEPGGGGMSAHTYGIGDIKTVGRAIGNDLYGTGHVLKADKTMPTIQIDSDPPETNGSLDPELVRKVIRSHVSQIRFCYEERLASKPSLAGKIRIRFLVNGEGRVPKASIAEGTTIEDPQLLACLLSRFRSWEFPAPKGGGSALVTYPVWLRPTGE